MVFDSEGFTRVVLEFLRTSTKKFSEIQSCLLKIEGDPFQSPYRKGKQFDLNGTKDQIAYYNKNTWVVKVRFAEYMKELQWQWSNELAVVECNALAETYFEIQVNTIGQ